MDGTKGVISGYKIEYYYTIGNKTYKGERIVSRSNKDFLNYLYQQDRENRKIEIFYKKDDHSKTYINTNINSKFYKIKMEEDDNDTREILLEEMEKKRSLRMTKE